MIQSFADDTRRKHLAVGEVEQLTGLRRQVWARQRVARVGPDVQRIAQRKLRQLNAAERLEDLRLPPGNDQLRICFRSTRAGPEDVEVQDP